MRRLLLITISLIIFAGPKLRAQVQEDFYDISTIQDIRITLKQSNWKHTLDSIFQTGDGKTRLMADVTVNGHPFKNAGVRYKGFSSWDVDYIKNPFCIYLDNTVSGVNYEGFTTIKLSNVIHDPSFVREALSYEILRKYMPASRANYANLYINDTLIGLYTNVESVDNKFTGDHFGSKGNSFFKGSPEHLEYPFGQNANLANTHGDDTTGYMPYYSCESDHGWPDLLNLIDMLNNDTLHLPDILNIDRTLWMHAFNYTLLNLDSYIGYSQNYYLYLNDNGRFDPVIWDLNMSFGSFRLSDGTSASIPSGLTIDKVKREDPLKHLNTATLSPRPLTKNLFRNTTYRKMYLAHMRTILNENFRNNDYYARAQAIQGLISPCVYADTNKFYSDSEFTANLDSTTGPTADQYPGIKDLMEARLAYLDTFPGFRGAPYISLISHLPLKPARGEATWISAKITDASFTLLGVRMKPGDIFSKVQMFDDGLHHDGIAGDSIYGTSVIAAGNNIEYYIWAENDSAGIFSPERAEYEFYNIQTRIISGDIVINEFTGDDKGTISYQGEDNDGWIEMFNNTNEDLDLKGLYLSDNAADLSKWAFPDTMIKAKGFFIVRASEDTLQSGPSTGFALAYKGGSIILSDEAQAVIDSVTFGQQLSTKTIGRYPNGTGSFVYMQPSFSKNNLVGNFAASDLIVYPNPANNRLYVEFANHEDQYTLGIYNVAGQLAYSEDIEPDEGQMEFTGRTINISALQNGVYIIKLAGNDEILCKKVIIY